MTDKQQVTGADGDPKSPPLTEPSFGAALHAHRSYLERLIRCRMDPRLKQRLDVSDIVQETYAEAARCADGYRQDPGIPMKLWLRRLACHRLVMAQRRHIEARKRSITRELPQSPQSSADAARVLLAAFETPSEAVSDREQIERLQRCMDELKESDREIILLQMVEGLSARETGIIVGINEAAARKRLGRAIIRLRSHYSKVSF